jgi:hypothetical protein
MEDGLLYATTFVGAFEGTANFALLSACANFSITSENALYAGTAAMALSALTAAYAITAVCAINSSIPYGTLLPASGEEGELFLQISNPYYELPLGGLANQVLMKQTNNDRDVTWGNIDLSSKVSKAGDTMTGRLKLAQGLSTGSRINETGSGIEIGTDGGIEIFHDSTPFIDFHY